MFVKVAAYWVLLFAGCDRSLTKEVLVLNNELRIDQDFSPPIIRKDERSSARIYFLLHSMEGQESLKRSVEGFLASSLAVV